MAKERLSQSLQIICCLLVLFKAEGIQVGITYLQSAVAKGAVCLDGSPPAYYFSKGSGAGINNWLVHFEGGGWCNNVTSCLARRNTRLGSSKQIETQDSFSGMFSNAQKYNPDFYNWNRIKVAYCDGSSFTGDIEAVDPATKLYYRGARIFLAVIDDLLAKGMRDAQNALISGCSAGGLASILHCDNFRDLLPASTKVKCLADAGYFINAKDVSGAPRIQNFYADVVKTHGSAKNLPKYCTLKMDPGLCFFPQNMAQQIRTPLFLVNSFYDSWQIKNILAPGVSDPHGTWHDCKSDITKCSAIQLNKMHDFRAQFMKAIVVLEGRPNRGLFINSCYSHCQTGMQETWLRADSPVLDNTTISKAVGDWYYDRLPVPFQKLDCPYPCDKSCHNRIFE